MSIHLSIDAFNGWRVQLPSAPFIYSPYGWVTLRKQEKLLCESKECREVVGIFIAPNRSLLAYASL